MTDPATETWPEPYNLYKPLLTYKGRIKMAVFHTKVDKLFQTHIGFIVHTISNSEWWLFCSRHDLMGQYMGTPLSTPLLDIIGASQVLGTWKMMIRTVQSPSDIWTEGLRSRIIPQEWLPPAGVPLSFWTGDYV